MPTLQVNASSASVLFPGDVAFTDVSALEGAEDNVFAYVPINADFTDDVVRARYSGNSIGPDWATNSYTIDPQNPAEYISYGSGDWSGSLTSAVLRDASFRIVFALRRTSNGDGTDTIELSFDLSSLPSGSTINDVAVRLRYGPNDDFDSYPGVDAVELEIDYTPAVPTAAITGTATASITEADIFAGGKTIVITLTNDTWVAAGATFDAQRQNIIDGIDSAQAEGTGWDAVVKATQGVAGVVRTSDTVVTITLDAQATYNISTTETITVTVPSSALTGAGGAVVASPAFTITTQASIRPKSLTLLGVG